MYIEVDIDKSLLVIYRATKAVLFRVFDFFTG